MPSCHRVRTSGEDGTLGRAATRRHQQLDPTWEWMGGGELQNLHHQNNFGRQARRSTITPPLLTPLGKCSRRFGLGVVP